MSHGYSLRLVASEYQQQWDDFIDSHPQGHFLQSWGWGELKASAGWHPQRLALYNEQEQIVAAAQVLCRTAPHLPLRAGHLAYIPKGPVIDWSQPELCAVFFSQLHAYLRRQGAIALRVEPAHSGDCCWQQLSRLHFHPTQHIQPLRTIVLNLQPSEEALLAVMKEKWRYNVRLSQRKGVSVRVAEHEDDVRAWYSIMQTTSERDKFGVHTLEYYLQAWHIFAPRQQARLFLAEYEGKLLAGIFVTLLARQAIYLYGASSNEQRNLMPNYLLQWEAIRWAKQAGANRYDFWGIPATDDAEEEMAGVYRFKRGWGGEIVRFVGCYEYIYRPAVMHVAQRFLSI